MKALEKMVKRRYETASEFLTALVATPEGADASDVSPPVESANPNPGAQTQNLEFLRA